MRSYRPEELFDNDGAVLERVTALAPTGDLRMSANPHANGGLLTRELELPDFRDYAVEVQGSCGGDQRGDPRPRRLAARRRQSQPGTAFASWAPMRRVSNRLGAVLEATNRVWEARRLDTDDHLAPTGSGDGGALRSISARAGSRATC